jgi:hypothetical protein
MFKIRFQDGKFSTGGSHPGSSEYGKIWQKTWHLKAHLNLFTSIGLFNIYKDATLVNIATKEEIPLKEYIDGLKK